LWLTAWVWFSLTTEFVGRVEFVELAIPNFSIGLFSSAAVCEKGLRGRARCVVSGVSAAVAIAAWLGRALAVGVRKLLGGIEV